MACPHSNSCPLFPKLQASMKAWRDAYCDTGEAWEGCARFTASQEGKPVAVNLLPNGKVAKALDPGRSAQEKLARENKARSDRLAAAAMKSTSATAVAERGDGEVPTSWWTRLLNALGLGK